MMNQSAEHVYTPSELNREVRTHLEMGFPRVLLEAEISNLSRPASGHLYFSLKDDRAQVRCAMFRSSASRTRVIVENGKQVLARGKISLYEPRGDYQFIVDHLEDAGEGLLQRQFDALKKKLDAEGLFDPATKQEIKTYPSRIGLVTSSSGAAVRDLLHVLARRWPIADVRLYAVPVQGPQAADKISHAIEAANSQRWAETLIIGRGGGSLEDLAAFNDEALARTIFASAIPVISAVGHETDFSITDFVADLRAPTPSAAAELATPDATTLTAFYSRFQRQLGGRMQARLGDCSQKLDHAAHRLQQRHPSVELGRQQERLKLLQSLFLRGMKLQLTNHARRLSLLSGRLEAHNPGRVLAVFSERLKLADRAIRGGMSRRLQTRREQLASLARTLQAISPLETIARGYSVITHARTGEVVSHIADTEPGDRVLAQVSDGQLDCTVNKVN